MCKGFWKVSWRRVGIEVIIAYGLCAIVVGYTPVLNRIMFQPQPVAVSWEDANVVNIGEAEAPVSALWYPCPESSKVILYNYGNAEDLGEVAWLLEAFHQAGVSVLGYDYPGYGLSAGVPTEKGVYAAADTAYEFLVNVKGYAPTNIVVVGRSIGSGPACYLAEQYPVGGLVIVSGFTSIPRVATGIRLLPVEPFPNIRRIGNVRCPVLIIHGDRDEVIPFWHGQALYRQAPSPKSHLWVSGAGHNDIIEAIGAAKFVQCIIDFVRENKL